MSRESLFNSIKKKKSFLCVGLDTDLDKIPSQLLEHDDPIFEFNKAIIDATSDLVVAYKPNTAFYEAYGPKGMESLKKTIDYIPSDIMCIADAKRADIGNTSKRYAESYFNYYQADAITVAPYMGDDSIKPFLGYENKWVIILGLTSNPGSHDFQQLKLDSGEALYQRVLKTCADYGSSDNIMFVVGATKAEYMKQIRELLPEHFFLVPGVGAQGGDLQSVCANAINNRVGLLINSSRSIIYASNGSDFAEQARAKSLELQLQMADVLQKYNLL